jgi:hypothetical protein
LVWFLGEASGVRNHYRAIAHAIVVSPPSNCSPPSHLRRRAASRRGLATSLLQPVVRQPPCNRPCFDFNFSHHWGMLSPVQADLGCAGGGSPPWGGPLCPWCLSGGRRGSSDHSIFDGRLGIDLCVPLDRMNLRRRISIGRSHLNLGLLTC